MLLTPFPGSELARTARECGQLDPEWSHMTTLNPTFVPFGMSREHLETARSEILAAFYRRPNVLIDKLTLIARNPQLILPMLGALKALVKVIR